MDAVKEREVRDQLAALEDAANWEDGGLSYPLAHSLTLWLAKRRDFSHLVWVLESLGDGQSIDDAFQRVYRLGYAELCRLWAADHVARSAR